MILAEASTALNISITLLIIVHVVVSLFMILVVMMQRPKQEGLGAAFGGGMTDQLLGAGTTSFLQKATVTLGCLFFLISLILAILIGRSNRVEGLDTEIGTSGIAEAAPGISGELAPSVVDGEEEELLKALEAGLGNEESEAVEMTDPAATEDMNESSEEEPETPAVESLLEAEATESTEGAETAPEEQR